MKIDKENLMEIWNTKVIKAFADLNYDKILYPENIEGPETYITVDKKHIEGYEFMKLHKGNKHPTRYFVRSMDIKNLPMIIKNEGFFKVHCRNRVYRVIKDIQSIRIKPQKILNWREIIDGFGIPEHTCPPHYLIYRMKRLYGRTSSQFYQRAISESAFGKDKVVEMYRLLLHKVTVISDPTTAKLFYSVCHNEDITINELPDDKNKTDFIKFCNLMMRIGDKSNLIDNRARATSGSTEVADLSKVSVAFTHNVPSYYHAAGKKGWYQVFPYNVYNRYYPNLYKGFLQARFPKNMNYTELAQKYTPFYRAWIKSVMWYAENWDSLGNLYDDVDLKQFQFGKGEERFREHFIDFSKCVSHYAKDKNEYFEILQVDYESYKEYSQIVDIMKTEKKFAQEEVIQ